MDREWHIARQAMPQPSKGSAGHETSKCVNALIIMLKMEEPHSRHFNCKREFSIPQAVFLSIVIPVCCIDSMHRF